MSGSRKLHEEFIRRGTPLYQLWKEAEEQDKPKYALELNRIFAEVIKAPWLSEINELPEKYSDLGKDRRNMIEHMLNLRATAIDGVRCPKCNELISEEDESTVSKRGMCTACIGQEAEMKAYEKQLQRKNEERALRRKEESYNNDPLHCPKCGSTAVAVGRQGFGVGKAAIGILTLGLVGGLGGFINKNKTLVNCGNCGHKWKP